MVSDLAGTMVIDQTVLVNIPPEKRSTNTNCNRHSSYSSLCYSACRLRPGVGCDVLLRHNLNQGAAQGCRKLLEGPHSHGRDGRSLHSTRSFEQHNNTILLTVLLIL